MNDLERRAQLGDKQAQKECTRQWVVLACPHCGGEAEIFTTEMEAPYRHTEYQVMCKTCFASTWWNRFKYDALDEWNTRTAPPIGRCLDCDNTCPGKDGSYLVCVMHGHAVKNDSWCNDFDPKEG